MSFCNSNMAGRVLGATFSLLLLASIIEGIQNGAMSHYKVKAVVGQNATLHCSIKKRIDLAIFSMEWSKEDDAKLAIYSFTHHESHLFHPNLTLQVKNETSQMVSFYLHLPELRKRDSGTYICVISTFPLGSVRTEIDLTIEDDISIECNVQNTLEVYNGENVTIDCNTSLPNAQYRWAKNKNAVSDNESLKLWMVTDANAGVYTLTVITGKKTLHKEFIITVLQATTSLRTDIFTVSSPHQNGSTIRNLESTTTMSTTNPSTSTSNITMPLTELSTTSPVPHSDINHSLNPTTPGYGRTTTQEIIQNQTELHTPHTEDMASTWPEESSSIGNITDKSEKPDAAPTVSEGNKATVTEEKVTTNKDTERGHLLLLLIIVPVLLLIAVAGFLYRRQVMKSRMDLPPPFKPPPPPVKYTAPRCCETSKQPLCT